MADDSERQDDKCRDENFRPHIAPNDGHRMTFQFAIAHLILHIFDNLADPGQQEREQRKPAEPGIQIMHERRIRQNSGIAQLEHRHIRHRYHHRRQCRQEGYRQITDHEEAFVTRRIEPQEPGHDDEKNREGHAAKKQREHRKPCLQRSGLY